MSAHVGLESVRAVTGGMNCDLGQGRLLNRSSLSSVPPSHARSTSSEHSGPSNQAGPLTAITRLDRRTTKNTRNVNKFRLRLPSNN
jgi:hypothetical protein